VRLPATEEQAAQPSAQNAAQGGRPAAKQPRACTLPRSKVTLQSMQVKTPLWQPRMWPASFGCGSKRVRQSSVAEA
jgi:hypothetical protein